MKSFHLPFAIAAAVTLQFSLSAATHYVDAGCTNPVSPYTSWATAATNIQDAVNHSTFSDIVLVTNGVYQFGGDVAGGSNRVDAINNGMIQSVNGPLVTTIVGYQVPGTMNGANAVRCVNLREFSTMSGFTISNGATTTLGNGGGVQMASSTTLSNCIVINNTASSGGGIYSVNNALVINCKIIGNVALASSSIGGGAYGVGGSLTFVNCLFNGNKCNYRGGAAEACTLINCTVVGNTGQADGIDGGKLLNCIAYYNSPDNGESSGDGVSFSNCCVATLPGFGSGNNFTNAPLFADLPNGDYHLNAASPCINAGVNAYITNTTDFDGNPREFHGGAVDLGAYEFQASVHYVMSNAAPTAPYTDWTTAATNIQDAITASFAGDFIVVSNGLYGLGSGTVYGSQNFRVAITKPVTVQSLGGPAVTAIICPPPTAVQMPGVYLTNGATLSGFTISNGVPASGGGGALFLNGGGVWCESSNAIVTNCWLIHNTALQAAGGGAFRGTLLNCLLTNNSAKFGGGACSNTLINCTLIKNTAIYTPAAGASGGGAIFSSLSNCILSGNTSTSYGGGVSWSTLNNCVLSNNAAGLGGGAFGGTLNNCLVSSNLAGSYTNPGGHGGAGYSNVMNNCLILYNQAGPDGDAVAEASALTNCTICYNGTTAGDDAEVIRNCTLRNSVLYYNLHAFNFAGYTGNDIRNSCVTPPSSFGASYGINSITNEPLFVDKNSDYHLNSNSPCINSGNNNFVFSTNDLDGNPRIAGGTVDIGAYEFQSPSSILSYAWSQQYGFATDGSADNLDSDGDGFSNYAEWKAGTNPTNAASLLEMSSVAPADNSSGATITWQSVSNINYFVQCGSDLSATPIFTTIASNIVGQAGTTSYNDTTATNSIPYFYRVGVQ